MASIYDHPHIYDTILRAPLAQIKKEVASVARLLQGAGISTGRTLELACGTCTHSILLCQQGFSSAGIDRSPAMLAAAQARAGMEGIDLQLYQRDIVNFKVPEAPFDCVLFMAETFPLITDYAQLQSHFRSVRRVLRRGGLYVIDIDAHRHGIGTEYGVWGERKVELADGWVDVWHEDFPGDWVQGTRRMVMHCRIHRVGQDGDTMIETADEWHIRMDSPWNLSVLVNTLEDWSLHGFYSWQDLSTDISNEEHFFMVLE